LRPVDLSDEGPDVFQSYLSCVYFGSETLKIYANDLERQVTSFSVMLFVHFGKPERDESSITNFFQRLRRVQTRSFLVIIVGR
jgi:hypothetical protein